MSVVRRTRTPQLLAALGRSFVWGKLWPASVSPDPSAGSADVASMFPAAQVLGDSSVPAVVNRAARQGRLVCYVVASDRVAQLAEQRTFNP